MAPSASTDTGAQRRLLQLARESIAARLYGAEPPAVAPLDGERAEGGVFVTLKLGGTLRGCIGVTEGAGPLDRAVQECALGAAFRDPRFRPLALRELDGLRISISLLTPPEPMLVLGRADLLAQLEPGADGLVIEEGARRATFLPQVWEQLPEPERFLEALLNKAGLPGDYWSTGLRVSRYYSVSFAEPDSPGR